MINEKNNFLTVSWLSGLLSAEIFISTGEWGVQMPPLTSENSYFLRSGPQGATLVMFTTLPNYDSRLKPSGSSRWSQRFSQALGFARLDSVSLLFASYLDDFSSLQYRYVRGWNMRYKRFHLFMDSEPDFYFICTTNPPASLCASRPTFSSEDLFTSVSETCMHHGAIRCCYLISLRTKMNRGISSWNISVCFDCNIKVLWLTSNRCWADVGRRHQPNVEATLGRHPTANIDPTSAQHMFPCSFFTPLLARTTLRRNRPNAGSSDQFWSSSWHGYRPTVQ